ncbi:NB5R2 [Enterospora canceri]|uniref:NB5R2 n=1 Tax=Enterospora canceri TaxID=1081671 RepID=A0A1Y1S885_9MICR|nr:NB5R2 [Enterospora canceri]
MELKMTCTEKTPVNHNVVKIVLECEDTLVEMPVSSFVLITSNMGMKRPYTPIEQTKKHLLFYVKVYEKGNVSRFLGNLKKGDPVNVTYFVEKRTYTPNEFKNILFVAGGTGITPCLQVIREIVKNKNDKTKCTILNYNSTPDDCFCKEEIEEYCKSMQVRCINRFDRDFNVESDYDFVYVCGPPGFMECISGKKTPDKQQGELKGILKDAGYTESHVFKF